MITNKDKQKIINGYYDKTSTELANEYNVTRGIITKIWKDAGCKGKWRKAWYKDLTNQKFGFLTVINKTDKRSANGSIIWHCVCDCGKPNCLKEKDVDGSLLRSGRVISCGAVGKENLKIGHGLNFKDLTGKRFGKLIVLKRIEDKIQLSGEKKVQYECLCDCGRKTNVLGNNLVTGNTQTCGHCNERSHGNLKVESLLLENKIPFTREKRFDSCKDKGLLPFDFFVDNKYLIEYDGCQHFCQENTYFDYDSTHKHDIIKNNWCKENNIPLIRIPYTHFNDLTIEDLKLETSKFII